MAAVAVALLTAAPAGCKRLEERQAIRKYARGATAANAELRKLRTLEASLLSTLRTEDAARVKAFVKEQLLPQYKRYVEAVKRVPLGTARLRAIHGRYYRAVEACYEAHANFAEELTRPSMLKDWQKVVLAKTALKEADKVYRREMAAYYKKHNVKLADE